MDPTPGHNSNSDLAGAVRQLVEVTQRIAESLGNLERMYADQLGQNEEQRKQFAERQKQFDERQREREMRFAEQQKKWEEQREKWHAPSPWRVPAAILIIAVVLMAVAQFFYVFVR
jgi:hypothetical protein